jgi:putative chitinase
MDYTIFYAKSVGRGYSDPECHPNTHYDNEPIDKSDGKPHGESHRWGDASTDVQKQVIDAIISQAQERGLSTEDTANLLAIARTESGYNPDAAAGPSTASGVGQLIDSTGSMYGLDDSNRFDITANVNAMIGAYLEAKAYAAKSGHAGDIAWIYKYYHDGSTGEYGGLTIARNSVLPLIVT